MIFDIFFILKIFINYIEKIKKTYSFIVSSFALENIEIN